jgi:hypothetical protein
LAETRKRTKFVITLEDAYGKYSERSFSGTLARSP